jgi:hypothetical protein
MAFNLKRAEGEVPMKRVLFILLVALSPWQAYGAQGHPDSFSGTWTLDPARSESAQPGKSVRSTDSTIEISRSIDELLVTTTRNGKALRARFQIPNSDPKPVGTSGGTDRGTIANWNGREFTTITPMEVNGKTVTVTEKRTRDTDGGVMTVETSVFVHHGYEGGATTPSTTKDVYLKAR